MLRLPFDDRPSHAAAKPFPSARLGDRCCSVPVAASDHETAEQLRRHPHPANGSSTSMPCATSLARLVAEAFRAALHVGSLRGSGAPRRSTARAPGRRGGSPKNSAASASATPSWRSTTSTASTRRSECAAALLEVVPAPTATFRDHDLELPVDDLSDAVFVATTSSLRPVPRAWRECMTVLELPGNTEREKRVIATGHRPAQRLARHGLTADHVQVADATVGACRRPTPASRACGA